MIGNSICWRFIEPIADTGFYEDEVVEHLGTLHRARRRAFNPKLSKDEHALAEICRQGSLMGNVQYPALPRYYGGELVEGQYTIVSELIEGRPFIESGVRGGYQGILDWCDNVLKLVEELTPLEAIKVDFSRIRSNQIVVSARGRLRFTTTWPVGNVQRDRLDASPFLARLVASPHGGLFVSDGPVDMLAAMENLQLVLFHLATGSEIRTVAMALEEDRKEKARTGATELPAVMGIESTIAELILSLKREDGSREIQSLPALATAARKLRKRTQQRMEEDRTGKRAAASGQSSANFGRVVPPTEGEGSGRSGTESSGPFFPTAPPSAMAVARDMAASPAPRSDSKAAPKPRAQALDATPEEQKPQYVRVEEEFEHDTADALYPKRPDMVANAEGVEVKIKELPKAKSRKAAGIRNMVLVVVAIVIVLFGAMKLYEASKTVENLAPVAVISSAPTKIAGIEKVVFDAAGSNDPENKALTYHWKVIDPENVDCVFRPNDTAAAMQTNVQFFQGGTMTVQLRVFDGALFSEPVTTVVEVTGR